VPQGARSSEQPHTVAGGSAVVSGSYARHLSGAITPAVHARAALLASLLIRPRLPRVENELLLIDTGDSGVIGDIMRHHRRSREMRLRADELAVVGCRRDEMLAVISHELRSPLAAIHNAVQLLESPMTEPPRRQWAQALIERQFLRMMRLQDDLLDVSRINIGHVQPQRERMDLRFAINNAIETLEHRGARPAAHTRPFRAGGWSRSTQQISRSAPSFGRCNTVVPERRSAGSPSKQRMRPKYTPMLPADSSAGSTTTELPSWSY
jgi:signal transduction histidine kinase